MLVEESFDPFLTNTVIPQFRQIYKIFQLSFFKWQLCENMFIFPICLQATSDMFVFKIFIPYQLNWQKYGQLTELNYL